MGRRTGRQILVETMLAAGSGAAAAQEAPPGALDPARRITTPPGPVYEIVVAGEGPEAKAGQTVLIHETTRLADGTVWYSTRTRASR